MSIKNRVALLILVIAILAMPPLLHAQQTAQRASASRSELETLRRSVQEQNAEISKLRDELRDEKTSRERQQAQLDALIQKLDSLASVPSSKTAGEKVAIVPAVLQTSAAATPTPDASAKQSQTPHLVENGFGKVKFTGLLQGWAQAGDRGFGNSFRIRRAELRFSGDLLPNVKWSVMFDLAKALSLNTTTTTGLNGVPVVRTVTVNQTSRIFQEAFVTLGYFKRANLNLGQFKVPLSQEGLQSTAALDTVERALFMSDRARGGALGDVRDIGVMAFGPLGKQVDYQLGVFNGVGESQNDVDQNKQKAFAGRFVFHPTAIKGLQIGTSGAWSQKTFTINPQHERLGGELVYQRNKVRIKSEYMMGIDGDIHRYGYYAHFGYRLQPKLEAIFRYDVFDPNTGSEATALSVTERDYIGGLNYYIHENNLKLQVNYLRKTFANSITPSRDVVLVNLQTAW